MVCCTRHARGASPQGSRHARSNSALARPRRAEHRRAGQTTVARGPPPAIGADETRGLLDSSPGPSRLTWMGRSVCSSPTTASSRRWKGLSLRNFRTLPASSGSSSMTEARSSPRPHPQSVGREHRSPTWTKRAWRSAKVDAGGRSSSSVTCPATGRTEPGGPRRAVVGLFRVLMTTVEWHSHAIVMA